MRPLIVAFFILVLVTTCACAHQPVKAFVPEPDVVIPPPIKQPARVDCENYVMPRDLMLCQGKI